MHCTVCSGLAGRFQRSIKSLNSSLASLSALSTPLTNVLLHWRRSKYHFPVQTNAHAVIPVLMGFPILGLGKMGIAQSGTSLFALISLIKSLTGLVPARSPKPHMPKQISAFSSASSLQFSQSSRSSLIFRSYFESISWNPCQNDGQSKRHVEKENLKDPNLLR